MEHKDIDLFIKAKKKTIIPSILAGISIMIFSSVFILELLGIEHGETLTILTWAMAFYFTAFGAGKWAFVPRDKLMNIIERQINNDAEALSYLSTRSP